MGRTLGRVCREYVHFIFKGHDVTTPQSAGSITDNDTLQSIFFLFSINVDIQDIKKYVVALRGVPDFKVIRLKERESFELAGLGLKLNPWPVDSYIKSSRVTWPPGPSKIYFVEQLSKVKKKVRLYWIGILQSGLYTETTI